MLPPLDRLNWPQIRALARTLVASERREDIAATAHSLLDAPDAHSRMLATYLLGCTAASTPANLDLLRERAAPDPSWEVQEALAQAFDAYCAATGYKAALPAVDAWLADAHPNLRRAVSEGLRPRIPKSRAYFAQHPTEAIRSLAALRAAPSDYVRRSAGNALRDIRRLLPQLVDAETATWDLSDPAIAYTYRHVEQAR